MQKVVSVNFWLIFSRDSGVIENPPQPCPVTKSLLKRVKVNLGKIVICANDQEETAKIEGRQPECQEELIKSCMETRLEQSDMPYDSVVINRPRYSDFHISSDIVQHKGWEEVLLRKLNGKKAGG